MNRCISFFQQLLRGKRAGNHFEAHTAFVLHVTGAMLYISYIPEQWRVISHARTKRSIASEYFLRSIKLLHCYYSPISNWHLTGGVTNLHLLPSGINIYARVFNSTPVLYHGDRHRQMRLIIHSIQPSITKWSRFESDWVALDSQGSGLGGQNGDFQGSKDSSAWNVRVAKPNSLRKISTRYFDSSAPCDTHVAGDLVAAGARSF